MKKQMLLFLVVAASFIATLSVGQAATQKEKQLKSTPASDTSKPSKKTPDTVRPQKKVPDTTKL